MTAASQPVTLVATVAFVAVCIASDVRTMRIPNALTGPAMLLGLALSGWYLGWVGIESSLAGLGLSLLLLVGPFALGGIGAGDVKMMGAVGALLGPRLLLYSLGAGFMLGGIIAVAHLARMARLGEKLATLGHMVTNAVMMVSIEPLKVSAEAPTAVALPYSVPLGIGTLGVLLATTVR